eukprot:7283373-Prymnesium_polylepis.1
MIIGAVTPNDSLAPPPMIPPNAPPSWPPHDDLAAVAEELVDGADLVRGRGRARVVVWLRHAVLQEDL